MYFEIIRILTLMRKFRFSGKKTRAGDNLSVCVLNLLTEVSPQMTKFLKFFECHVTSRCRRATRKFSGQGRFCGIRALG